MSVTIEDVIVKLNDEGLQKRVMFAVRKAMLEQLEVEGVVLDPEMLAQLATRVNSRDAAETLAAGAVFIATLSLFSDARLKTNINSVGVSKSGINIYEFSYLGYTTKWRGVLAQEVQKTHPNAVSNSDEGFLLVDYSKIDVMFSRA